MSSGKKKTSEKTSSGPKEKLEELLNVINQTASAKGWKARLIANDGKNHRYATVEVSRYAGQMPLKEVTGTLELTCDNVVKLSYHSTSFYSYGLSDLRDAIWNEICKLPWLEKKADKRKSDESYSEAAIIDRMLRRFHRSARKLKHRHDDREPFEIKDEYDIQDLLHSQLCSLFDDVRAEEYTPSYAGGSSRVDFLLKAQKIAIETKMTSKTLKDKQIGEQLLIDIARYKSHPDCNRLVCFVYDPEGHLKNPAGLEADLSKIHDKLDVKLIIVSTGT